MAPTSSVKDLERKEQSKKIILFQSIIRVIVVNAEMDQYLILTSNPCLVFTAEIRQ
jgi:hypothetical protein